MRSIIIFPNDHNPLEQARVVMSSRKYLCVQRSQAGANSTNEGPSPAEMEQMYAKFIAWKEKFHANIVDMGGKLGAGKVVTPEGAMDVHLVEAKEVIGGFMIISADNMEEAAEIARQSPGVVRPGSSVEVREIITP